MTPGARAAAAIELLDAIVDACRTGGAPADRVVQRYFQTRRYAGSGDRRAVRAIVWRALRASHALPSDGRAAFAVIAARDPELSALCDGEGRAPPPLTDAERAMAPSPLPDWLAGALHPFARTEDEHAAMDERAPLDLRCVAPVAEVAAAFPDGAPIAGLSQAWRLPTDSIVEGHPLHRAGGIEVQDAASQWAVRALDPRPGETILDLCAGAGGKTLAIIEAVGGEARFVASDSDRTRLSALGPRAARAGRTVETRLVDPGRELECLADLVGRCDRVLVDAPCSGSGTWRRAPELRWRLTPERLARTVALQERLVRLGAELTRPGGTLLYAVCSVLRDEGEGVVERLLGERRDLSVDTPELSVGRRSGPVTLLTPAHDGTDGFAFSRLRRGEPETR